MQRLLSSLSALVLVGSLFAADQPALPAEAAGFSGSIVGTLLAKKAGVLNIKVTAVTPDGASKASDASKLKDTEVAVAVAYDTKNGDKWGINPDQAAAVKTLTLNSPVTVQAKCTKKGNLVLTAPPKSGEGAAEPKKEEAKKE